MRRRVYVINTTVANGGNLKVDTGASNSPNPYGINSLVDSNGKLVVAWNKQGATYETADTVAETRQALVLTLGDLVPGQKYTLIREANPLYMAGRDANYYGNTKRYSWTAPAVIADQAASKAAMIVAILAKVNADASNYAVATSTNNTDNITITENAGYGLLPSYPGPARWMMTSAAGEITHVLTAGKVAVNNGNVMLANKAEWTLDKVNLRSGELDYNFGDVLPVGGKTYVKLTITEKYSMVDHGGTKPDLGNQIIVYINDETAADIAALKSAIAAL